MDIPLPELGSRKNLNSLTNSLLLQPLSAVWDAAPNQTTALRFAAMLLEASAQLVDLPAAEFDLVVVQILDRIATHLQMDYVGLSLIQTDEQQLQLEHGYYVGVGGLPSFNNFTTSFPWYAEQLRAGIPIVLPRVVDDLSLEAEAEWAYLQANGVKSSLVIPLHRGEKVIGSLNFNSLSHAYSWSMLALHALMTFARVLAGAIQRKRTDDAPQRSQEQLRLALTSAGVGTWVWDLEHPELSYGSDNFSAIHGLLPCLKEQSLPIYLSSLHPSDRLAIQQLAMRCISGELQDFAVEHQLVWPDGSVHWVEVRGYVVSDATGRPLRLAGVIQEITPRKMAKAQLEDQHQELARQARMMAQTEKLGEIGGWEWDVKKDAIYWTQETYRIHGVTSETYTPTLTSALGFYTPASRSNLQEAIRNSTQTGEAYELKLQLVNAPGKNLWLRVTGRTEMVDGKVVRLYGSVQDITLHTELEEQLREFQKMEAIGQLAGGIAHDFNNLLTTINSISELATIYLGRVASTPATERVHQYLGDIHRAGERAAQLTHQLLAFSRKQILQPKVIDLRSTILQMQPLLHQLLGEKIELVNVMPSQLALVVADSSQVEQVLINLAINAREAMPNGGKLTIKLANANVDQEPAYPHVELRPDNYVVLEVQDNGRGITPEVKTRLFDPFFTTKAVGEGTGLGLATVYGIVKQSGGMIEVESEINAGSTFRIFLPQSRPQQAKK
jgi:two-component system cell cycle sensor histidine kinase/response regulator CckA